MKYLRKFNEALSESELSKTEEELIKLFPDIEGHFTINPEDGTIDVGENIPILIHHTNFQGTKLPYKFGHVRYKFAINNCPFTTLEGSPHTVSKFYLFQTQITDLVGGPVIAEICSISCCDKLVSLKGLALNMDILIISNCPITSLEGCPSKLGRTFTIESLKITNLVGGPNEVEGNCEISGASITSLEGMPTRVGFLRIICPNVWDPSPLRDVEILNQDVIQVEGPLEYLIGFFCLILGGEIEANGEFYNGDWWDKFRDSLDYNYVRERDGRCEIIHFRFLEALSEIDIKPNDLNLRLQVLKSIGPYYFVDENGDRVNLLGDTIPNGDHKARRDWESFFDDEDYDYPEEEEEEEYDEEYDDEDYDEEED